MNACLVKENPADWLKPEEWSTPAGYMKYHLEFLEHILFARLTADTFHGITNFLRATTPDTPVGEIEKALVSKQQKISIYIYRTKLKHFILDPFLRNISTMTCPKQIVHQKAKYKIEFNELTIETIATIFVTSF